MRKLDESELTQIQNRLNALKIYFVELNDELYDHYVTELEKLPETEFQQAMERLNESFAWSVVRKMERNFRKISNQEVTSLQLDSLKFWKRGQFNWGLVLTMLTLATSSYLLFGLEGLFNFIAVSSVATAFFIWLQQGKELSLNLDPKKNKPVKMLSAAAVARLGSFFSFGSLLLIILSFQESSENPGPIGLIIGFMIAGLVLIGLYNLLVVSAKIKTSNKVKR